MTDQDDELISLTVAAALIPGATVSTLRNRARQGLLVVYRPGKAYLTTRRHVRQMVEATVLKPAQPAAQQPPRMPPLPAGITEEDISSAALELARKDARARRESSKSQHKSKRKR